MLGLPSIVKSSKSYEKLKKTYNFGFIISSEIEFIELLNKNINIPTQKDVKKIYDEILNPDLPLSNLINDIIESAPKSLNDQIIN